MEGKIKHVTHENCIAGERERERERERDCYAMKWLNNIGPQAKAVCATITYSTDEKFNTTKKTRIFVGGIITQNNKNVQQFVSES